MFAAMEILELWRTDWGSVTILILAGGAHQEAASGAALAVLTGTVLTDFLAESRTLGSAEWVDLRNGWASRQRRPSSSTRSTPPPRA